MTQHPYLKTLLLNTFSWLALLLAPVKAAILALLFLITVDFFTGVWAARKRGEKIESSKVYRTITKSVVYQIAVICALVTERYITGDTLPLVKTMAGFCSGIELLSVYENLSSISGIPLRDALKKLLDKKPPREGE